MVSLKIINLELSLFDSINTVVDESDDDDDDDDELAVQEEATAADAASIPDDGRAAHDASVIKTTRQEAIEMMRLVGVEIDQDEEKMALQLFPWVRANTLYVRL
jgi:hypothetical protein